MKDMNGKNVIITGAGTGLGAATAIGLARKGANIAIARMVGSTHDKEVVAWQTEVERFDERARRKLGCHEHIAE